MRRILFALAVTMLLASAPSRAQTPDGAIVLNGRVTQAGDTSIVVGGADIEIVGTAVRGYADREGRFKFADLPAGSYELRVRRLGYEAASRRVVLEGGHTYNQAVELRRHPHALTEVRVDGRMLKVPARFEDVYARATHEHGTFFFRQDIEKLNPYDVGSLIMLVPTAQMHGDIPSFARCAAGLNGLALSGQQKTSTIQVYIDGTRMTQYSSAAEAIRRVMPRDIEAMEVYTSAGRLPAEFLEDACAVIAIWTTSY